MALFRFFWGNSSKLQTDAEHVQSQPERIREDRSFQLDSRQNGITPLTENSSNKSNASISLATWASTLTSSLVTLRRLAGATENEFLQIGSKMQGVYQRATTLSQTAQNLVEVASGERINSLIEQLRQILNEMETYLEETQGQNSNYCTAFNTVESQLGQIAGPLEGFKKMSKELYILEVLIKIESSHVGVIGGEFLNLALDINKLTHQIKEKSDTIQSDQLLLSSIISKNIKVASAALSTQETMVLSTHGNTVTSIAELESVNQQFFILGSTITSTATENSNHISQVVQSMQFHDIFRQQVEHVTEALEGLLPTLEKNNLDIETPGDVTLEEVIRSVGDVCELQEAQLQFASGELYGAVASIIDNLADISGQQKLMAQEIFSYSGISNISGRSFIDDVRYHMESITELLTSCAETNSELAVIMKEVTDTVDEITGYVSEIEGIGNDIHIIALNARIKAAGAGLEGASLCVLAEKIGFLSHGDAHRTDMITASLTEIHATTGTLYVDAKRSEENLAAKLIEMKAALSNILSILGNMGTELIALLSQIQKQVDALVREIETINCGIDVHERAKAMADEVLNNLRQICEKSRELYPASDAFKEDLRLMSSRYTMESERRIHEDIARKHGVLTDTIHAQAASSMTSDSEFGDNVDLF